METVLSSNIKRRVEWLRSELAKLDAKLRPASQAEIAGLLSLLFAALPAQAKPDSEDLRARVYVAALKGVPIGVLEPLVTNILCGQEPDFGTTFVPTPPQLAIACRARRMTLQRDRYRRNIELRRLTEKRLAGPAPLSVEEQAAETARRAEKVARAKRLIDGVVAAWDMKEASKRPARTFLSDGQIARAIAFIQHEDMAQAAPSDGGSAATPDAQAAA